VANPAFVGDVLFSSRLCDALIRHDPGLEIVFLARPPAHQLATLFPGVVEVVEFDKRGRHRGLGGVWNTARRLKRSRIDTFVACHRGWRMAALSWLLGPHVLRVSFRGLFSLWYHRRAPWRGEDSFFAREAGLLRLLGVADAGARMAVKVPDSAAREGVVLAPGTFWPTKRWPVASFIALARKLGERGIPVRLTGGPAETVLCQEICAAVPAVENRCGESLETAARNLAAAQVAIAHDSGLGHLARAVSTPVVLIFGPTPPEVHALDREPQTAVARVEVPCAPCSAHGDFRCPEEHFRCLQDLSVQTVLDQVDRLLAGQR